MNYCEKKSTIFKKGLAYAGIVLFEIGVVVILFSLMSGCAFKRISRYKNISYTKVEGDPAGQCSSQSLNVFAPHRKKELKDVFIFIHGGNWSRGKKTTYNFFGSRMARKNVVTVVIDYPLSPEADYQDMTSASAQAIQWVRKNIERYGGNPMNIYVSGHSSGGHLAALVTLDNRYFEALKMANPIKGIILLDAAGLDMPGFIKIDNGHRQVNLMTFSADSTIWEDASPLHHLRSGMPPMLIYTGEKTYPLILEGNEKFIQRLNHYKTDVTYYMIRGKKHVAMITQFFWPYNPRYKEIIAFMREQKNTTSIARNK